MLYKVVHSKKLKLQCIQGSPIMLAINLIRIKKTTDKTKRKIESILNSMVLTSSMLMKAVLSRATAHFTLQSGSNFDIPDSKHTREQGFLSYCLASLSIASLTQGVSSWERWER